MRMLGWIRTIVTRDIGHWALFATIVGMLPVPALADYKLQPGDTLEFSIAGIQSLKQRLLIGVEGEIAVPLVGHVKVVGITVAAARARIAQELSNKVYREVTNDGREISHLIVGEEIVAVVAEYRPIYVNGDVAKPGEYVFRPGMTVRQALAVAGGVSLAARLGAGNPFLQAADLRAEYQTLSTEFAREQARSTRLRNQLGEVGRSDRNPPPDGGSPPGRFAKSENEQYNARLADRENDITFLRSAIQKTDLQLAALAQRKIADENGNRSDLLDFEKVKELAKRGLATMTRLSEARRVVLLSSNQLLQTTIDVSNAERQRAEHVRQLEKIESQERINDLRELQDTELKLAQISIRVKSTGEKLAYAGAVTTQFVQESFTQPLITVHRQAGNGAEQLSNTSEDLELAPGDVVEVSLKGDRIAEISGSKPLQTTRFVSHPDPK